MANWYRKYEYNSQLDDYAKKEADRIVRKRASNSSMSYNNDAYRRIYKRKLKKYHKRYGNKKPGIFEWVVEKLNQFFDWLFELNPFNETGYEPTNQNPNDIMRD